MRTSLERSTAASKRFSSSSMRASEMARFTYAAFGLPMTSAGPIEMPGDAAMPSIVMLAGLVADATGIASGGTSETRFTSPRRTCR